MKKFKFVGVSILFILVLASGARAQDQSSPYLQAGNTFYSQKNYNQAIRYYQAAVQFNANSWQAYQGLGGCYYAKGDNGNALANYQKSLDINPNNTQVSQFVQYLKTQTSAPPLPSTNNASTASTIRPAWGHSDKNFELNLGPGVAIDSGGSEGLGIGGSLSGFYMMDQHLGFGGMIHFYSFGYSTTTSGNYLTQSFTFGNETITDSYSVGTLEVVAALKYKLDGNGF